MSAPKKQIVDVKISQNGLSDKKTNKQLNSTDLGFSRNFPNKLYNEINKKLKVNDMNDTSEKMFWSQNYRSLGSQD